MANLTETGHAKNVANFEDLIRRLEAAGAKYMPTKTVLQLTNLKQQLLQARQSMEAVTRAIPAYSAAVDAREAVWKNLNKLVTRAHNVFKASIDDPAEAETAFGYAKKIKGGGHKKKTGGETAENGKDAPRKISTSQQSYDMVIQHFEQFITLLSAHAKYQPNEEDLRPASLNNLLKIMKARSNNVVVTKAALDTARTNRDNTLYAPGTGLVDVGQGVKGYVRGGFTPDTAQYRPILGINFKSR